MDQKHLLWREETVGVCSGGGRLAGVDCGSVLEASGLSGMIKKLIAGLLTALLMVAGKTWLGLWLLAEECGWRDSARKQEHGEGRRRAARGWWCCELNRGDPLAKDGRG
ncbi:hypothetical protein L1887_06479 [Cichorium endivia]|nr:hypothetical protein L1887_06479 [Cichorium endivia]